MTRSPTVNTSLAFVGVALLCLLVADLEVATLHPWAELWRMVTGAVTPNFLGLYRLLEAMLQTVAFAFVGVALGGALGFGLALLFHYRIVRLGCAFVRAIHELFWALIFIQMFGPAPLTGLLALALPYAGIFAKVYSEILEEADQAPLQAVPEGTGTVSLFLFARLPDSWPAIKNYTAYRFECGLRSSAVLGFVGLPTLGFYLESSFSQGLYSEVAALLLLFYLLVASLRLWVRPRLAWLYVAASLVLLWQDIYAPSWANVARFFTQDIVPGPLHDGSLAAAGTWSGLWEWMSTLAVEQALPGAFNTVVLTQIALVGTGILTLAWFPLISRKFFGPVGRLAGHLFLVVTRTTPEYILTFVFLSLWGPSMLPAIVALALHNGAIIGHLVGRHTDNIPSRPDAPRGLNLYGYEVLPRVYGQFLAFLFYRWEVIMRETAILGILGIHTLGFYIDSAFADIRFDRALFLILFTAVLNIGVDAISRTIRGRLKLTISPDMK